MTTFDYYSISPRFGLLLFVLSCSALINHIIYLDGVMGANSFKCIFAIWSLIGMISIDIVKNGIRQWRRQAHPPLIGQRFIRFRKRSLKFPK